MPTDITARPPSALGEMAERHPILTWAGAALSAAACIGLFVCWHFIDIPRPESQSLSILQGSNVQIVPRIGAVVLRPASLVPVSIDEFRKQIGDVPFTASYWRGWSRGEQIPGEGYSGLEPYHIEYFGRKPGSDVWLFTYAEIPHGCFAYDCKTVFDGRNTFSVVIGERDYAPLYVCFGVAFFVLLIGNSMLGVAYKNRAEYF
jgi:hypothetical protein